MDHFETFTHKNNQGEKQVEVTSLPFRLSTGRIVLTQTQKDTALFLLQDTFLQERLSNKLRNNSQAIPLAPEFFGQEQTRPLSAYFFFIAEPPAVITETGLVGKDGVASLHTDMNNAEGHQEREQACVIEVSGHVWNISQLGVSIALFDRYEHYQQLGPEAQELVRCLTENGFVCVGTEGSPLYSPRDLKKSTPTPLNQDWQKYIAHTINQPV